MNLLIGENIQNYVLFFVDHDCTHCSIYCM